MIKGFMTAILTIAATIGMVGILQTASVDAKKDDQKGNNGTVKIDGNELQTIPRNEPHVGCSFNVEFFNYGKGDDGEFNATVTFELQKPTVDGRTMQVIGDTNPYIGGDAPGGGTDLDASVNYTLSFTGKPHKIQGYHVKLTINAPYSQGADVKHKVFWVTGCDDQTPKGKSTFRVLCDAVVIRAPRKVSPEGAQYQYYLDGEPVDLGKHDLEAGEHTLVLKVNDTQVDSDTFTIRACGNPTEEPNTLFSYVCDTTKQALVLTFVNTGTAESKVTVDRSEYTIPASGVAQNVEVKTGTQTTLVTVTIDGEPAVDAKGEFTNRPFVCVLGRGNVQETPTTPVTPAVQTTDVESLPVTSGAGDQAAALAVMIGSIVAAAGGYALRARGGELSI